MDDGAATFGSKREETKLIAKIKKKEREEKRDMKGRERERDRGGSREREREKEEDTIVDADLCNRYNGDWFFVAHTEVGRRFLSPL